MSPRPLPVLASQETGLRLRHGLEEAGFTEQRIEGVLPAAEAYSERRRSCPRLKDRTREPALLSVLLRWFLLGIPVDRPLAESLVPAQLLGLLLDAGLLRSLDETSLEATATIKHAPGLMLATDFPRLLETGEASQMVLGFSNAAELVGRFAMRTEVESVLDLGAGCGIQGLLAAFHAKRVVATDINERAVAFTDFNAKLNGLASIVEVRAGDRFQPVHGERFDLILSNPPFFVTPPSTVIYRDNAFHLDEFCHEIIRQAPDHLTEGGHLQMLFEWVELEGQPWQERLAPWFEDLGCDVWLLRLNSFETPEYVQRRLPVEQWNSPQQDAATYAEWMEYHSRHGVNAVHGGLLTLRKREGKNWIRLEHVGKRPDVSFGGAVSDGLRARDLLAGPPGWEAILNLRPALPEGLVLEQEFDWTADKWNLTDTTIERPDGLSGPARPDRRARLLFVLCDGQRTVAEVGKTMAERFGAGEKEVTRDSAHLLLQFAERGLVNLR